MEEEKVKKKKKKKGKKGKKDGGPKKPSEKSILEAKISELAKELSAVTADLQLHESILGSWKARLKEETEAGEACVSHLRRSLKTEAGIRVQGRLEGVRNQQKEVERKAEEMGRMLEVERKAGRSAFEEQRTEQEDKLSSLEERRQKRSSQLSHIEKLQVSLEDKLAYELRVDRQENKQRVEELLHRRDQFEDSVDDIVADHEEMFRIRLPVYAREQLRDNIRFRASCQDAAEDLLSAQDKNKVLKSRARESLQSEIETQDSADRDLKSLATDTGNRLDEVLREVDVHRPVVKEYLEVMRDEIATMTSRMEAILDEIVEVEEVIGDQDRHRKALEGNIEKTRGENGLLESKILRASRVFKARVNESKETGKVNVVDTSVLHQIRMILECKSVELNVKKDT